MSLMLSLLILIFSIAMAEPPATMSTATQSSAKQFMIDYWTMETNGGRLTEAGWKRASSFFLHSIPRPAHLDIAVVYDDSAVWNPLMRGDYADVTVGVRMAGQIDSELKYSESRSKSIKQGVAFHLIRGDAKDQLSKSASGAAKTKRSEWKLDHPSGVIWLNLSTAIRYVSDQVNQTNDPILKKNAANTLRKLRELQSRQGSE